MNFDVGDLVFAHLRKDRFPRGEYNKFKLKKIGHCRIVRKFSTNAYEIGLPSGISISPIFNVSYLYTYMKLKWASHQLMFIMKEAKRFSA